MPFLSWGDIWDACLNEWTEYERQHFLKTDILVFHCSGPPVLERFTRFHFDRQGSGGKLPMSDHCRSSSAFQHGRAASSISRYKFNQAGQPFSSTVKSCRPGSRYLKKRKARLPSSTRFVCSSYFAHVSVPSELWAERPGKCGAAIRAELFHFLETFKYLEFSCIRFYAARLRPFSLSHSRSLGMSQFWGVVSTGKFGIGK